MKIKKIYSENSIIKLNHIIKDPFLEVKKYSILVLKLVIYITFDNYDVTS